MRDRIWFVAVFIICTLIAPAQEVKLNGGFVEDSLGIGEEIHFWLAVTYPIHLEVLFPDSNYNFSPFEYVSKYYMPTRVRGDMAYDTTVYTLQSFEIDLVQRLTLPGFVIDQGDSLELRIPADSICFKELVAEVSDSTMLKQNIAYQDVHRFFNFPMMWVVLGVIAILSIAIFLIYGKRIRRYFQIKQLNKNYRVFSDNITQLIHQLKDDANADLAETALKLWKDYLERLEAIPYSKLTTKEILGLEHTSELKQPLASIDKSVYGRLIENELYRSFQAIEDFTQHRFSLKIDTLKHGN